VNDPRTALGPYRGARGGVVHVRGSVSALMGTPVRGGTERRPMLSVRRIAQAPAGRRRSYDDIIQELESDELIAMQGRRVKERG
jgi:hypothetical protein